MKNNIQTKKNLGKVIKIAASNAKVEKVKNLTKSMDWKNDEYYRMLMIPY